MRFALIALCLVGCVPPEDDGWEPPPDNGGWGSGWGGTGGGGGGHVSYGCESDAECGGLACARTGQCLDASLLHVVQTVWTVSGVAASETSCVRAPELSITFYAPDKLGRDSFGFTPVPCRAGKFTVDKMPTRFESVELARRDDYGGGAYVDFDTTGTAKLDLPY
jgi:hypothetical protein